MSGHFHTYLLLKEKFVFLSNLISLVVLVTFDENVYF